MSAARTGQHGHACPGWRASQASPREKKGAANIPWTRGAPKRELRQTPRPIAASPSRARPFLDAPSDRASIAARHAHSRGGVRPATLRFARRAPARLLSICRCGRGRCHSVRVPLLIPLLSQRCTVTTVCGRSHQGVAASASLQWSPWVDTQCGAYVVVGVGVGVCGGVGVCVVEIILTPSTRLLFDDRHGPRRWSARERAIASLTHSLDTGIYTYELLYELGTNKLARMRRYLR